MKDSQGPLDPEIPQHTSPQVGVSERTSSVCVSLCERVCACVCFSMSTDCNNQHQREALTMERKRKYARERKELYSDRVTEIRTD